LGLPSRLGALLDYARLGDEDLVTMVAQGRAGALEALYDRYAGLAYGLSLRILGDRGAAEEVVQDTFVAVWRRAYTFDPEQGRLYSWLFKIARNRAIDELRRRSSPTRGGGTRRSDPEEAAYPAPDPEALEAVRAAELRTVVGGALADLPRDQREVVEMAYLGGLSQREIAERTGIPLGTVKTRTRLALQKLRKVLGPVTREAVDGM
jgi:RNA polymerase sigma-70 factor, ECF subfamily